MLAKLAEYHDALAEALAGLAALTDRDLPDASRLAQRRLALSRASMARSRFIEFEIYPHLLATHSDAAAETIRQLRTDAVALRIQSAQHVGRWPLDAAIRDWRGYCAASRTMRAAMRQQIGAEQNRLYPLVSVAFSHQVA